jgi:hypothetical protein
MTEDLTNPEAAKTALRRLHELIEGHGEWLYVQDSRGRAATLRKSECDFRIAHGRLIFSCRDERGMVAVWRVSAWEWTGEKLTLEATRRMGAERARLSLVPRASVKAITETISSTRRHACEHLAELACALLKGTRIERAGVSAGARQGQHGKMARIILRRFDRERIAVTGIVADSERADMDAFLSSTLIWFTRACESARPPYIEKLWLITEREHTESLMQRLALLRDGLRRVITLYEIDAARSELTPLQLPELDELLRAKPEKFHSPIKAVMSESAARIVELAPEAIDVVSSRRGETLRFHGLAFARVRRVMKQEKVWFGIEGSRRRLLEESTLEEWTKLLSDLKEHRRAEVADQRHALYKSAPESWLESKLRRDITQLDSGLIIAPLYAQFRSSPTGSSGTRPVDLLALRQDGRLVLIELKVSEDRQHVLQGADYWRRVTAHHLAGHIRRARLFDDAEISDEPPLIYLVAPLLSFHRGFKTLARAINPRIEMYRFDINEDWRASVRVVRRTRAN